MKLFIVAEGKIKDRALRAVADEYLTRVRRYVRCEEIEVRDASALGRATPGDCLVVAMEVHGELVTSEEFAERLARWARADKGQVAFLIGGKSGVLPEISRAADLHLSLSRMTLPHRLARVVLLEQLYRALASLRGEPYAS